MQRDSIWLSRDMAGSGLYTIWLNGKPEINKDGYYKFSYDTEHVSILLVTIHPSKWPFEGIKLDRGDCIELALTSVDASAELLDSLGATIKPQSDASKASMGVDKPTDDTTI